MKRIGLAAACAVFAFAQGVAQAEVTWAPWFDGNGFYTKSGVSLERATNDLRACHVEAIRLAEARRTGHTSMPYATSGDPAIGALAGGIAMGLMAIQDARYNSSIQRVEFHDCAVSLGYRHVWLSQDRRTRFNATEDHGFAALVSAEHPADGRADPSPIYDNYFDADLVEHAYENPAPQPPEPAVTPLPAVALEAPVADAAASPAAPAVAPAPAPAATQIARVAANETAQLQDGAAIVVVSVRQHSGIGTAYIGDELEFTQVTDDGGFAGLTESAHASFKVVAHHNGERRNDPSLAGDSNAPRYSTFVVPAGRYALNAAGPVNACLGTVTFNVKAGEVAYLGDWVYQPQGIPLAPLFNPLANINSSMDSKLKSDVRIAVGDDLEAARTALQASDDLKAQLTRVAYQTGYRIPCTGGYIGRVSVTSWAAFSATQFDAFNDAVAQREAN